jgi:hypothetical protein
MADDIARLLELKEAVENPTGISECLVDNTRRMVPVGIGRADNPEAISTSLVREILPKARTLELIFHKAGCKLEIAGYAHGGFIRHESIQSSSDWRAARYSYSFFPVTAKHNLRHVNDYHLLSAKLKVPYVGLVNINSPDFDWLPTGDDGLELRPGRESRPPAICGSGFDVSVGGLIDSADEPITEQFYSFALVRETFTLEEGQKVGIAVYFNAEAKPRSDTISGRFEVNVPISEQLIELIYGVPNVVNIYTGQITYAGEKHIEYDFNAFKGCAGSIVFLLDIDQPTSVQECDFGKAVAVHSGAHPGLADRNYGFMLRHHHALK